MMGDTIGAARRRQLLAAVSMLSVSLGMSSAAVADQIKGETITQKVTPGEQSAQKVRTQSSIKGQAVEGQSTLKQSTVKDPLKTQNSAKW